MSRPFPTIPAAAGAVALLSVTTLALATGPARAATSSFADPAGDARHGVDLREVSVLNGDAFLRVTTTHRDLVADPASGAGGRLLIDTDPEDAGPEYALVGGYFDGTDYALLEVEGWNVHRDARRVDCSYRSRLDYEAETVRSRFARDCFGDADVRVELRVSGSRPDGRAAVDWLGSPRRFTPRVAQG